VPGQGSMQAAQHLFTVGKIQVAQVGDLPDKRWFPAWRILCVVVLVMLVCLPCLPAVEKFRRVLVEQAAELFAVVRPRERFIVLPAVDAQGCRADLFCELLLRQVEAFALAPQSLPDSKLPGRFHTVDPLCRFYQSSYVSLWRGQVQYCQGSWEIMSK